LSEFFRRLIQKVAAKGMLTSENSVMDKLQQWVFSLSSTNFRPFRHTATNISLGFITTFCDIYAKLNKEHDNSTGLLEKEKKLKKSTKIKSLEKISQEQQSQLTVLSELMESTYDR
jgi:cohesin complex subunit SA-1/2